MKNIHIYNLVHKVENELYIPLNNNFNPDCENWAFDDTGSIPVYIVDIRPECGNHLVFTAMQPSGDIVKFRISYDVSQNNYTSIIGRPYALAIGRYAEIKVKENEVAWDKKSKKRNKSNYKNRFIVEEINFISDETIMHISSEMFDEYVLKNDVA